MHIITHIIIWIHIFPAEFYAHENFLSLIDRMKKNQKRYLLSEIYLRWLTFPFHSIFKYYDAYSKLQIHDWLQLQMCASHSGEGGVWTRGVKKIIAQKWRAVGSWHVRLMSASCLIWHQTPKYFFSKISYQKKNPCRHY